MTTKYFKTFFVGGIGGWLFSLLHFPIPWLLGALASISVLRIGLNKEIYWSKQIRNAALIILGYMMGRTFTPEIGQNILSLVPILILVTFANIILCIIASLIMWKFTKANLATSLFGSMPAGLAQVATICEKEEDADIGIITLMQSIRLITVLVIVPFIALHALAERVDTIPLSLNGSNLGIHDFKQFGIYFLIIIVLIVLGKYLKISNVFIVFPLVTTAGLAVSGLEAPALPSIFIIVAQICVGIHIATTVNIATLADWKSISFYSLLNMFGVLLAFSLVDYLITIISPITFLTAFISTAPGGMAEMGFTAMMVHADVSTVATFQLFRLLFIILVVTPGISWGLKILKKRTVLEICNESTNKDHTIV